MMNKLQANINTLVLLALVITGLISTYLVMSSDKYIDIPLRGDELVFDGCETESSSVGLFLGEKLEIHNRGSESHRYKLFDEEIVVESNNKGTFELQHDSSMYGRLICDDRVESTYVKISIPETVRR